jgi:hypothetical protein
MSKVEVRVRFTAVASSFLLIFVIALTLGSWVFGFFCVIFFGVGLAGSLAGLSHDGRDQKGKCTKHYFSLPLLHFASVKLIMSDPILGQ